MRLKEGKQVGTLYHYTSFKAADSIIKGGGIKSGKPEVLQGYSGIDPLYKASISFTRDKNFHKAYRELSTFSLNCRFVVNGDVLSNKYKIQPAAASGYEKSQGEKFEAEEVVLSKTPFTIPLDSSYIISFDVLYNPVEDLEVDGYKFIKTLKQLTDKGIKVNIVDKNGNPVSKELKVSFIQWLKKPLRSIKRTLAGYPTEENIYEHNINKNKPMKLRDLLNEVEISRNIEINIVGNDIMIKQGDRINGKLVKIDIAYVEMTDRIYRGYLFVDAGDSRLQQINLDGGISGLFEFYDAVGAGRGVKAREFFEKHGVKITTSEFDVS